MEIENLSGFEIMSKALHQNKITKDEIASLTAAFDLDDIKKINKTDRDMLLRPCERTYNFQGIEFTPDYINELASRNRLVFLLNDKKQEGIIFDNDEIYQLIEAVCDNWRRYYESC